MNNLRLIRIYELRGNIHPIEQWVIDLLYQADVLCLEHMKYYNKDNKNYIEHNLKSNNIYLYSLSYSMFGCSYEETKAIMKYLLEKHLNITINKIH